MKKLLILSILFQISVFAEDQSISTNQQIQYTVSTPNPEIGKPFSIVYTMPQNIAQILAVDSNIKASADMDLTLTNPQPRSFELQVVSYSPISHAMPSLLLTVLENGQTNQYFTPSFQVVLENELDEKKLQELTFIDIEEPFFVFNFMWLILFLLIAVLGGLYFYFKKYRHRDVQNSMEATLDPFDLMASRLQELKQQQTSLTEENYKEFFVFLSEAVREFLSYTLVPFALETPTRELLKELKDLKTDEELFEIIQFIMRSTDRAKYAKQIFTEDRIAEVVIATEQLLKLIQQKRDKEQDDELRKS
ncbi:MAG: hypothetical protein ACRCS8_06560 [Brevinema sp.]